MSKHLFKTKFHNEPITICIGWDRPLQGYFMFIERPECDQDEDRYLYSNLDDEESHPETIDRFLEILRCLNLAVPEPMVKEVLEDGVSNCGNKTVEHRIENGRYKRVAPGGA